MPGFTRLDFKLILLFLVLKIYPLFALKNLVFNYKYLSSKNKGQFTGATIKANAYGLGDCKIIKVLYKTGCKHFFVTTLNEAIKLRQKFKFGYIYVLNGVSRKNINISRWRIKFF